MCGRYTSALSPVDLGDYFAVDEVVAEDLGPRYNVAPTDEVYAVAERDGGRRLGTLHWGLVPPWAEGPKVASRMINARAETIVEKPAFRRTFARRRCILPADGFYEWGPEPGSGRRRAWYVRRPDGEPLAFAGLWERWRGGDADDAPLVTATIVTTEANDVVRPVHGRMPVVLPPSAWGPWLDPGNEDVDALRALLLPAPAELFELVPVGPAVGNVANDGPELIERQPLVEPERTLRLIEPGS